MTPNIDSPTLAQGLKDFYDAIKQQADAEVRTAQALHTQNTVLTLQTQQEQHRLDQEQQRLDQERARIKVEETRQIQEQARLERFDRILAYVQTEHATLDATHHQPIIILLEHIDHRGTVLLELLRLIAARVMSEKEFQTVLHLLQDLLQKDTVIKSSGTTIDVGRDLRTQDLIGGNQI